MMQSNAVVLTAKAQKEIVACKDEIKQWQQQAPSPSRDYVSLVLNTKGVVLRIWHVNGRVTRSAAAARNSITEKVATHEEFVVGKALESDIRRYFGQAIFDEAIKAVTPAADDAAWSKAEFPGAK